VKAYRGFESLSLRQIPSPPDPVMSRQASHSCRFTATIVPLDHRFTRPITLMGGYFAGYRIRATGYRAGEVGVLTDAGVKAAKVKDRAYKLSDSGGLMLFVAKTGSKLWRMRYTFQGKEKLLSFGPYPSVGLAQAREQRDAAKALLRAGKDPSLEKKQRRALGSDLSGTFESVAKDWHTRNQPTWTERHSKDVLDSLATHVFPVLGRLPITEITAPMVLSVLRAIEARPALETARRVRQRISAVFVYAIALGIGENDPAAIVRGAMAPMTKGRQPAVTDLAEARKVLAAVEAIPAHPTTKLANRLLALTVVRPGELRGARWGDGASSRGWTARSRFGAYRPSG
jgi:hypothetical protein